MPSPWPSVRLALAILLVLAPAASAGTPPGADLAWLGNDLGLSDRVPSPWTPVHVDGAEIRVWGRRIQLSDDALPARISSQGTELLERGAELEAVAAGGPIAFTGAPAGLSVHDETRAVFAREARHGGLVLRTTTTVEYDGMIRIRLELTPESPAELRSLSFRIPLASTVARVMSRHLEYDFERRRTDKTDLVESIAPVEGRIDLPFNPEVWLGNREVGLVWAAETNRHWDLARTGRALSIVPGADATDLVVHFIDHPTRLDAPRTFEFALFPTPLKPVDPRLRRMRIAPAGRFKDAFSRGVSAETFDAYAVVSARNEMFARWESLPWSEDSARHRTVRRKIEGLGVRFVPYGALWYTNAFHPVGRRFYDEWHTERASTASRARWLRYDAGAKRDLEVAEGRHWDGYRVCASPRSYADFVVWSYLDAIRREDLDAIYFDHGDLSHACQNASHGHLEGGLGPQPKLFYGVFGARELLKRLWIAAKAEKPDLVIIQHQARTMKSLDSFVDVVVTGEVMNAVFSDGAPSHAIARNPTRYVPDYDRIPTTLLDYDYLSSLGFESRLLPQLKFVIPAWWKAHPDAYRFYSDKMLRRTLLRGIRLWGANMDQGSLVDAWRALDRIAPLDASTRVHPFWEPHPGIATTDPDTRLARYERDDRMLLIVGTSARRDVEETISLSAPHARFDRAIDAASGRELPYDGRRLRLEIPSERYRSVLFTQ